jgi:urea transporter
MSFREKSAWITLISILLVFVLYVLHVPNMFDPDPGMWELHVVGMTIVTFIVIEVVAHVVLSRQRSSRLTSSFSERSSR